MTKKGAIGSNSSSVAVVKGKNDNSGSTSSRKVSGHE